MAFRPFIIDTSDDRCRYLFKSLKKKGFVVREREQVDIDSFEVCILIFPPAKKIELIDVEPLKKGSAVFGGNASIEAKGVMAKRGIAYFNILQDEQFTVQNTIPTALGCIYVVMENVDECINDLKTLILGYGRVGKTLAKYLAAIDTKTYIYTVDTKERALAEVLTSGTESELENVGAYNLVINTVPAKLMSKHILDSVSKNAFVCDLASGSFVDIEYLQGIGVKALKAASLPGKVAPKSAARYMEECIIDTLNRNSGLKSVFLVQ